jgi:acyl-CoA synthetase (AMP-forming)/AMP-acid ligase II
MSTSVREQIDTQAAASPDAAFLIAPDAGQTLTYADVAQRCDTLARQLVGAGLGAGDKAAFLLDNGPWTASLFLGTMYAGLVTVPLNAVAGVPQIAYILDHCDAGLLFVSQKYLEKFRKAIEECPRDITVIMADEVNGPAWPDGEPEQATSLPNANSEDDALLLYTSGTTGLPKGARLSHRAVLAGGSNTALAHELGPNDRALCVLPLYHINGEMVTVMGPLVSGGSVVMPARFSAKEFWGLVDAHKCTWLSVVPTIVKYLLDRADTEPYTFGESPELARLRFGRSASAPLPASVMRAFEATFKVPMIETMGMTETAAPLLSNPMPPGQRKAGSPGVAFGNEVQVANDAGAQVEDTVVGEILIRGPNVLTGYYKNPEASASAFDADGWFKSGDLGYRDADGYYFITGRIKELIIKGGENIAPREIDDALYQHESILEAAAVGIPHENYGQDVVACVRLRDGYSASEDELRAFCEERVGKFKTPTVIHFMDDLPKGPSGKIQRLKLADMIS